MSRSVAWGLHQCPAFLSQFLCAVGFAAIAEDVAISLQVAEKSTGITDIEIESPGKLHVIVEAKRGWQLPSEEQLGQYEVRLRATKSSFKCLVALTDCSREYSNAHLTRELNGVPVHAISWAQTAAMAERACKNAPLRERYLLEELVCYLQELATMQNIESNWMYVVALATGTPDDWNISWIDIVNKKRRYFHPVGGNGWPGVPPNYIGFRYYGQLQSVHHLERYDVVTDLNAAIPDAPSVEEDCSYFVYRLGPTIVPGKTIKTGNIYRNGRVWCMLDTLLTCDSIADARDLSQKRQRDSANNS